jgi:tellurite resistance protein TerC
MDAPLGFWLGFLAFLLSMLALDLGVFHRRSHRVRPREAAAWSAVWVTLALCFGVLLGVVAGRRTGLEFVTGYVIEYSLSADNIFVIYLIFAYFRIPIEYQHRVLFWGILGAVAMRGAFIAAGAYMLEQWHWMMYVFGGILLLTAVKIVRQHDQPFHADRDPVLRVARRLLPLTSRYDGARFWTVENGRRVATPLFLALLLVETTDVVFAVDSIPAIFAVTRDPFVVFTSNAFAVLGLRSMYFLLAEMVSRFDRLKYGLAVILVFVGAKMLLADVVHVPAGVSFGVIVSVLALSVVASVVWPAARRASERPEAGRVPGGK